MNAESIVFLSGGYKGRIVKLADIVSLKVSQNDISAHLTDQTTIVVRGSLVKTMKKLPPEMFFSIGRDCVVNLTHVTKVDASTRNIMLKLKDGRDVTVSRQQSKVFRRQYSL